MRKIWDRIKDDKIIKNIFVNNDSIDGRTFFILYMFKSIFLSVFLNGVGGNIYLYSIIHFIIFYSLFRARIRTINKDRVVLSVLITLIFTELNFRFTTATSFLMNYYIPRDLITNDFQILESPIGQILDRIILSNQIVLISLSIISLVIFIILILMKSKREVEYTNLFNKVDMKILKFRGSIDRYYFLLGNIYLSIIFFTIIPIVNVIEFFANGMDINLSNSNSFIPYLTIIILISLFILLCYISLVVRRLKNIGISRLWFLLIIPTQIIASLFVSHLSQVTNTIITAYISRYGQLELYIYNLYLSPAFNHGVYFFAFIGIFASLILYFMPKKRQSI